MDKKIRVALLFGGISDEREVSLKTANQIYKALNKNKYKIFKYDLKFDLKKFLSDSLNKKFDLVFPALHGPFGEDGKLQGMLDILGIPYIFSKTLASALAMDKILTKQIFQANNILTAKYLSIFKTDYNKTDYNKNVLDKTQKELGEKTIIKPSNSGSSIGINIAENKKELEKYIQQAFKYSHKILVEKFINGRELSVAVIGNKRPRALPVIEIIPKISKFFDYKAKYKKGGSREVCPAKISDKVKNNVQKIALKVYKIIGCKDIARIDFILEKGSDKLYCLEVNTIPGMTPASLAPKAAKADGMKFSDFLDKLILGSKAVI